MTKPIPPGVTYNTNLWVARWRMLWHLCPACNSDAPAIDTCPVCQNDRCLHNNWNIRGAGRILWRAFLFYRKEQLKSLNNKTH